MIKNYIKIAFRNLVRNRTYSLINLIGLAIGMGCCILIALYVKEELSYDTFHEHADRIVAVGTEGDSFGRMLATPYPLADALEEEMPGVERAVRLIDEGPMRFSRDGQEFVQITNGGYSEPAFFEIFSFEMVQGIPEEALSAPNTIVLSEGTAEQLFGSNANPVGRTLFWQQNDTLLTVEVTGIMEDFPQNSSLNLDVLVSFQTLEEQRRNPTAWGAFFLYTYALVQSPDYLNGMSASLQELANMHYEENDGSLAESFFAMPFNELHLSYLTEDAGFTGNRAYLYLFGSVALFILLIACVNYVNLATARTSLRSKEVGVRKSLGAARRQVSLQFLGESLLLSITSYIVGIGLFDLSLPWFNRMFGTQLSFPDDSLFLVWLLLVAAGVGLLAGLYPALYLSRFSPASILRNRQGDGSPGGARLRKMLVVGQFTLALILISSSLVVYKQLDYTQTKDLGFEGDQIVAVELPGRETWRLRDAIRNNLMLHQGIEQISLASGVPGSFNIRLVKEPEALSPQQNAGSDEVILFAPAVVDYGFLNTLGIELLTGRNFSSNLATDRDRAYILNREGAEVLGWSAEEAVGKPFIVDGVEGAVIGVVENFHIQSLREEIEPVWLQLYESDSWYAGGYILARLAPDQISSTLNLIERELASYAPNSEFSYQFLDDQFDAMYRTEQLLGSIITLFTIIAILIACMGLYGLAAFAAERRIREIGIRKVLGATVANVVGLLSKDFVKLVLLGFVIAAPIAWFGMNLWLQGFAYSIDIGPGIFAIAGGMAMLIALATVSWQSVRAALANPVESLRSE